MPLWYQSNDAGANADGEYSWVFEDEARDDHLSRLEGFYVDRAPGLGVAGASAYPGFDVFGGADFQIPHDGGQTLADTLALADQHRDAYDFLQLVTWNDFGEGTVLEPTLEAGFSYLAQVQQFTGSPFDEGDLELVYRLYLARKKYEGNAAIQAQLDLVSAAVTALDVDQAATLLEAAAPAGDYDGDGDVDGADYGLWFNEYGSVTVLHGSGADGNHDGVVDAADFAVWRDSFAATTNGVSIPESGAMSLVGGALTLLACSRELGGSGLSRMPPADSSTLRGPTP